MLTSAILSGLIHILFFFMESIWWMNPIVTKIFRQRENEAEITKLLAFNQGFYNLFLAMGVFVGLIIILYGEPKIGYFVIINNCLIMLGASVVLLFSSPKMIRGVLLQGLPPLVYIFCFIYQEINFK
jgi:putative membrane protein